MARTARAVATVVGALGLVALQSGAAYAFDCIQASRSDKGNLAAGSHSQAWVGFVVADLVAAEGHPPDVTECILAGWAAAGGGATVSIHVKGATGQNGVIGAKNPNHRNYHDGRGIDHLEHYDIAAIYQGCGAEFIE